jgi:hypothetical protein
LKAGAVDPPNRPGHIAAPTAPLQRRSNFVAGRCSRKDIARPVLALAHGKYQRQSRHSSSISAGPTCMQPHNRNTLMSTIATLTIRPGRNR